MHAVFEAGSQNMNIPPDPTPATTLGAEGLRTDSCQSSRRRHEASRACRRTRFQQDWLDSLMLQDSSWITGFQLITSIAGFLMLLTREFLETLKP